jgi:hypothetical protein
MPARPSVSQRMLKTCWEFIHETVTYGLIYQGELCGKYIGKFSCLMYMTCSASLHTVHGWYTVTSSFEKAWWCWLCKYCTVMLIDWRMASSGMLRRVALVRTDVSEELSAFIIRVTRNGELGTTLAITSNRCMLWRNTKWPCIGC